MMTHQLPVQSAINKAISQNVKILIIGREHRFCKSLQELLIVHNYVPFLALSEQEVNSLLKQHHFSLNILDLTMVEINGKKFIEQIQSRQKASKLILLSNDSSFDQVLWAMRQGADDFIRKPFASDELISSINKLLSQEVVNIEKQQSHDFLQNSDLLHRFIVNNSPDIIYLLDKNGQFTFFNNKIQSILGFSGEELLGKHYSTIIYTEDIDKSRYVFCERRTGQRAAKNIELRLLTKTSESVQDSSKQPNIIVELSAMGVYKNQKDKKHTNFLGTYGVVRDISERKEIEKEFYHHLYHDPLTNLPNRKLLQDRLHLALCQAKREDSILAVMFLDIDNFKEINDSFGHVWGDRLLQSLSVRTQSCLRGGDTLCRTGGDEFIILIPRISSRKDTTTIARKIINELKKPFKIEHFEIIVSISIGISLYPKNSYSVEGLTQKADWAMYYVKRHGKKNFVHYKESIRQPGQKKTYF